MVLLVICLMAAVLVTSPMVCKASTVVAHRGASYDAPENTLASLQLGWEQGIPVAEIDIHQASDGRVMVMHDGNTKRTTGEDMLIKDTPSDRLRELDAGSWKGEAYKGQKVPFFEEILEALPAGRCLLIEVKCAASVLPEVQRLIELSGKRSQLKFVSFNLDTLKQCRAMMPDIKAYLIASCENAEGYPADIVKIAKEAGMSGINLHTHGITAELMAEAKQAGLDVNCWTVDDCATADRMAALGIDEITSNRPLMITKHLAGTN